MIALFGCKYDRNLQIVDDFRVFSMNYCDATDLVRHLVYSTLAVKKIMHIVDL